MNLTQLELKRCRELLGRVHKARHIVQAMRTPLARYSSLERQAARAWNRGVERLNLIRESKFETIDVSTKERLEELAEFASILAKYEKAVVRRIEVLEGSKKLTEPAKPIHERIAARRAQSKKERRAWDRYRRDMTRIQDDINQRFAVLLQTVEDQEIRNRLIAAERSLIGWDTVEIARCADWFRRNGHSDWLAVFKELSDRKHQILNDAPDRK